MEESIVSEQKSVEESNGLENEVKANEKPVENAETDDKKEVTTTNDDLNTKSSLENKDNSTEEPKPEPSDELLNKIKKQVEFYFGDVNMQRDKFLIEQTKLDDGWVPMTIMLNFKILASLSKDIDVILRSLENSDLIEVSEDKKKIRRSLEKPLPVYNEDYRKAQEARTVYLKGFPTDSTIETLKNYFEPITADTVESIIMRKYKKGKENFFKGSIFLQFKTLKDAKEFMEQESIKYKDTELIKMWSTDYLASKEKEREERREKKAKNQNNHKNDNSRASKNQKSIIQDKIKLSKGCIIHLSNIEQNIARDDIKRKFTEMNGEVAYVDYNDGKNEGLVRLQGENSAISFLEKLDSKMIKINDCEVTCKILEGDEEEVYLAKIQENMTNHRFNRREKGRNTRRGSKRRHSPHRDGNAKKSHLDDA